MAILDIDADPHNFGLRVCALEYGGRLFFKKPRSIFWEKLFFGVNSPLREILLRRQSQSDIQNFCERNFALKFQDIDSSGTTLSEQVSSQRSNLENQTFFNFGALCAYAFAFGILDLHRDNVVARSSHLQVVDVEVVLSKLILPDQTLLLPFAGIGTEKSAFSHLSCGTYVPEQFLSSLCDGYYSFCLTLSSHAETLATCITAAIKTQKRCPIRVIIRRTREYLDRLHSGNFDGLYESEVIQLQRGDVPYYFKLYNDSNVYYYTSKEGEFVKTRLEGPQLKLANAIGHPIEDLLTKNRLLGELLPNGLLLLARKLVAPEWNGKISWNNESFLLCTETRMEFQSPTNHCAARRFRQMST
jgi:lantibiotic modifying enzyme